MAEKLVRGRHSLQATQKLLEHNGYTRVGENDLTWEIDMGEDENGRDRPHFIAIIIPPPTPAGDEFLPIRVWKDGPVTHAPW